MKKLLWGLVAFVAVSLVIVSCGLTDPEDADSVKTFTVSLDTVVVNAGDSIEVSGTIEANVALSVEYTIIDSITQDTVTSGVESKTDAVASDKQKINLRTDADLKITTESTACNRKYGLIIDVTAGSMAASKTVYFTVVAGTSCDLATKTDTLGAQNATPPSCLDVDAMTAYSRSITDTTQRKSVDIIFTHSTALTTPALAFTAPAVAQGTPYSGWVNKAESRFKKVTSVNIDNIVYQPQIDKLWDATPLGADSVRMAVAANDLILVKTSESVYKMIKILAVNGSDSTATITVKGKY